MKKLYFLMLFVLMGFVADAQNNYLINPYYINTKQLLVDDSARISGATIINGSLTTNGNVTGVDKLVIDDSLRVGLTSIFNGAMTLNGNLTGVDKAVLDDSLRVGKTSIFNGAMTLNGNLTGVDKVVIDDSLRVGSTLTLNGATTSNAKITTTGGLVTDSIRTTSTATFNAALSVNAFAQAQQIGFTGSATIAVDSALAAVDSLKLASSAYTWIKIRGKSGTSDSVTTITGGVTNAIYVFQAVADDTTITLVDGSNLKLGGSRVLDAITDRIVAFFDGTNFVEWFFVNND